MTHIFSSPVACGRGDGSSADHAVGGLVAAVRLARGAEKPVSIHLSAGEYALSETLVLDERDSDTTFTGEGAVITGGCPISDWRDEGNGVVSAAVPAEAAFTRFYVDGVARETARYPETGFFRTKGQTVSGTGWANDVTLDGQGDLANRLVYFDPADLPFEPYRPEDVEFVVLQYWMEARLYLQDLNRANGEAMFKTGSWRPLTWSYGCYLENVREGLGVPGRWYHDRATHRVYYHLQAGETPATLRASYPVLTGLIEVTPSSPTATVTGLRFEGLTFSVTDGHKRGSGYFSVQAELNAPVAVRMQYATDSGFWNCSFENLGSWGLHMAEGCQKNNVECCRFVRCGAGGVRIGSVNDPKTLRMRTDFVTVRNNLIAECGESYLGAAGIWVGNCSYTRVEHNDISGSLQWAISLGWTWRIMPMRHTLGNRIAHNHVHDLGTGVLGCHGAIYLLGGCPATVVEYNRVENIYGSDYWGAGEGFILDNGCSGITVQYNLVRNAYAGGWGCNFNCFGNVIRNNIFAFGGTYQLTRYGDAPDTQPPPPNGEIFTQNVVIWSQGTLFKECAWHSYSTHWDYNLYWCTTGETAFMDGMSLAEWKKYHLDVHSVVADPLFADAENGDFSLAEDSPAYDVGFEDFSLEGVGILPLGEDVDQA